MFKLLDALEWKYPPSVIMEQSEAVLDDLMIISWRKKRMETLLDGSTTPPGAMKGQVRNGVADKV